MKILIIGQGIAGTCVAWQALKSGCDVKIIDECHDYSCSLSSSGIINPITGRSYVKSWQVEAFIAASIRMYTAMSQELGDEFIRPIPIMRHIPDAESDNKWSSRSLDPAYKVYVTQSTGADTTQVKMKNAFRWGRVKGAYQVMVRDLIKAFRTYFLEKGILLRERFDEADLILQETHCIYHETYYDAVIFCTGYQGRDSKLFATDNYRPFKGEVLICRLKDISNDEIVKFEKFVVPIRDDLFWIGSTNQWDFDDAIPNKQKSEVLISFLELHFSGKYEILEHIAGIRPATKYRRPLIGNHPNYPQLWLFNGLGTKGISMAPFWSEQIVLHLLKEEKGKVFALTEAFEKSFLS